MKMVKILTSYFIALSAFMFSILCGRTFLANAATTGTTSTGLEYEITGSSVTITGYTGNVKNLTIPGTINGYKVTQIGNAAFWDCDSLETVKLPTGIKTLGVSAFNDCNNLKSVNIPSGVTTIERYAFSKCSNLTSIFIPSSVVFIGNGTFEECVSLTSINIPANVSTIGEDPFHGAFDGCTSLTKITVDSKNKHFSSYDGVLFNKDKSTLIRCPEGRKGTFNVLYGVKTIDLYAFRDCVNLSKINIPSTVNHIRHRAFYYCTGLTTIDIPSGVTRLDPTTFQYCDNLKIINVSSGLANIVTDTFNDCPSLEEINVSKSNPNFSSQDGVLFSKDKSTLVRCPEGKKGTYSVPAGVTTIGEFAFEYCEKLEKVILPSSLKHIESFAFDLCYGLKEINLPSGLKTIGESAFYVCESMDYFYIPSSVESIADYTFCYYNLPTIYCEKGSYAEQYAKKQGLNYQSGKKECYLGNGKFTATISQPSFTYTGDYIKPVVTVKGTVNGKNVTLTNWKDYKVTYKNFKAAGTATITVTGRGDYFGELKLTFTIKPFNISRLKASINQKSFGYTGNYIKPVVTVKGMVGGKSTILTNWTDYKVTYKNFKNPGTATITITGRGNYTGTLTLNFTIRNT